MRQLSIRDFQPTDHALSRSQQRGDANYKGLNNFNRVLGPMILYYNKEPPQ